MRFADFSCFSIWFSVFMKNASGFSVLVPDVVFGFWFFLFLFSYLDLFGFRRNASQSYCGMRDKLDAAVGDHAPRMTIQYSSLFMFFVGTL